MKLGARRTREGGGERSWQGEGWMVFSEECPGQDWGVDGGTQARSGGLEGSQPAQDTERLQRPLRPGVLCGWVKTCLANHMSVLTKATPGPWPRGSPGLPVTWERTVSITWAPSDTRHLLPDPFPVLG